MNHRLLILTFCFFQFALFSSMAQKKKNKSSNIDKQNTLIKVTATVFDTEDVPLIGAKISGLEGQVNAITNDKGLFTIFSKPQDLLLIEKENYQTIQISCADLMVVNQVKLKRNLYLDNNENTVQLPFDQQTQRYLPYSVTKLRTKEIGKYDNRLEVSSLLDNRVPGRDGNSLRGYSRGIKSASSLTLGQNSTNSSSPFEVSENSLGAFSAPLIVVDGIPRSTANLNALEIDEISVLKDVASRILYGSQASEGVIFIKTKRGRALTKEVNVFAESSIGLPVSYLKFLNAPKYMELYNEARANDGLAPLYTPEAIENTINKTDLTKYPDQNYYGDEFLNTHTKSNRVIVEYSGGNNTARYYLNTGWLNEKGLIKNFGDKNIDGNNFFTLRSNLDIKANNWIDVNFDINGQYGFGKEPNYSALNASSGVATNTSFANSFWKAASTTIPNAYPFLIPASLIKDENIRKNAIRYNGDYVLGGSNQFQSNPYGEFQQKGAISLETRSLQANVNLNLDLQSWVSGLKGKVGFSFDSYNFTSPLNNNRYAVYSPTLTKTGTDTVVVIGTDVKQIDLSVPISVFSRRYALTGMLSYDEKLSENGDLSLVSTFMYNNDENSLNNTVGSAPLFANKFLTYGFKANYIHDKKYIIELTGAMSGSTKYIGDNKYAFSPAVSLGWIASEELFLKNNKFIQFLKLRANYGSLATDRYLSEFYANSDLFGFSNNYGSGHLTVNPSQQNTSLQLTKGNPDLTWSRRTEISVGFDAKLGNKFLVEATYFTNNATGLPVQRSNSTPATAGGLIPIENFGEINYKGFEMGINYTTKVKNLHANLGLNMLASKPTYVKVDEFKDPKATGRYQEGQATDAIYGYVSNGFFKDQADIDNSPNQVFSRVSPGDLKYEDLNGDNVINENDQKVIGNSSSRLLFGLNINLSYKRFDFFALTTYRTGTETINQNEYDWNFGNRKYSEVTLNRWTPQTAETATYPRLTTTNGANNFRSSTFWLKDNSLLQLSAVQLSYNFNFQEKSIKTLKLFFKGNNLLNVGPNAERINLNVNGEPKFRFYTLGLIGGF